MKKTVLVMLVWTAAASMLVMASHSEAFDCNDHTKYGEPNSPDQLLCRDGFVVGYNFDKKSPEWVSYKLTRNSVSKNEVAVKHMFAADTEVSEKYRVNLADYKNSGFDKGHLAPPQLMNYSHDSMKEAYLLSNVVPQKAGFNRYGYTKYGAWGALETYERSWAIKRGELFVVAGPIYLNETAAIGNSVPVPTHFFKIFFDPQYAATMAFLIPHEENTAPQLERYITSIDCIESITGLNFFNKLEAKLEQDLENSGAYQLGFWAMKDGKSQQGECAASVK